jgi:hypothetical protein
MSWQDDYCPLCGEVSGLNEINAHYRTMLDIVRQICDMKSPTISEILTQDGHTHEASIVKKLENCKPMQEWL